jgi:hypothetical protein
MRLNIHIPDPEVEETLHSLLVTASRLSAYHSFRTFTGAIFKHPSDGRGWSWNYKRLCAYLDPCRATAGALLHNMLLLPYLVPFMPPEAARIAERRLDGDRRIQSEGVKSVWREVNGKPLRYCPLCTQIQMKRLGRSIWLRPHQLERVEVCWRHAVRLVSVSPHRTKPFLPHECPDQSVIYSFDKSEIWLARQSHELLVSNHPPSEPSVRKKVYQQQAARLRYGRRRIDCDTMSLHLVDSFGPLFFERVMGTSRIGDLAQYVESTIYGEDPSIRPINQLLCIHALFGEQRYFFEKVRGMNDSSAARVTARIGNSTSHSSILHRQIFLSELKKSGERVMASLHEKYPHTHAWILRNALSWSRRKVAELIQGPDRLKVLQRRAAEERDRLARERELRRRAMSAIGGSEPLDFIKDPDDTPIHDLADLTAQLRNY